MRRFLEAQEMLQRAKTLSDRWFGAGHVTTAVIALNLPEAHRQLGELDRAPELLAAAVPLLVDTLGKDHRAALEAVGCHARFLLVPTGRSQGLTEVALAALMRAQALHCQMPPRHVPEDALVDDAPGGATAASIAELEKRLTAQAEALEKRLAEQFEAAAAALLARLAPPVQPPPPKGTQPAIPAGAPAVEGGEQGAQEPLPAELDALDTELEYVDFAYFGQVSPSGLEPPLRDGDEPRLWILTDDTELEKRLTAQPAEAPEKRLAEQFEAATAALLARLAPPVQPPPPKGTQPAIPAGAPGPEGGEQGAQEPLPAELDALDTELDGV
eukprot:jgi/Tetstr1/428027/TSEL_000172.t1